jgi:hypothetical protein
MFQTWIRNVPEQFYSRQPMFQAKKMFQTWIRNVPEQFHSRQPMFHAKNENVSIFFVMHVDIINAKCFSFFSSPNSCCSSCFHMFQRQIINVFRINVLESMSQYIFSVLIGMIADCTPCFISSLGTGRRRKRHCSR